MTYLLPCSCGRDIPVEPRHAGETVHCECGRTSIVPAMREVQSLRPALAASATPAAPKPAWGNSQRMVVAGMAILLLATIAAVILYRQFPAHFAGLLSPEDERQRVMRMSPQETRLYFHQRLQPGIDLYEGAEVQSNRSKVRLGMATLAGVGAIGLILVGVGVGGIVGRH